MLLRKGHPVSGASPAVHSLPEQGPRSSHPPLPSTEETSVIARAWCEAGQKAWLVNELSPGCSTHSPHTVGETEAEKAHALTARSK